MVKLPNGPGSTREPDLAIEEWQGPEWPVWGYRIAAPDDPLWPVGRGDWSWTGGIFVDDPSAAAPSVALLPGDGHPPAMYRPAAHATDFLRAALRVDPVSRESVLGFVNAWGLLSVGTGLRDELASRLLRPSSMASFDSVWATQRALIAIQEHFRWLVALKRHEWSSADIPATTGLGSTVWDFSPLAPSSQPDDAGFLRAALQMVAPPDRVSLTEPELVQGVSIFGTTDPYLSGFARRRSLLMLARATPDQRGDWRKVSTSELHWRAFSVSLVGHLQTIHPVIRFDPATGGALPAWRSRVPIDVLWVAIWDYATQGGRIVRCPNCQEWFVRDRRNKEYCSATCANRATSRRWYETVGRTRRGHTKRQTTTRRKR